MRKSNGEVKETGEFIELVNVKSKCINTKKTEVRLKNAFNIQLKLRKYPLNTLRFYILIKYIKLFFF